MPPLDPLIARRSARLGEERGDVPGLGPHHRHDGRAGHAGRGVASEALREIITGFLDEVRFD